MDYREEKEHHQYQMEELIPIVAMLADKYTSKESTSITYEKAQQLMDAVLYCINEAEQEAQYLPVVNDKRDANSMYNLGLTTVKKQVQKTLNIYNDLMKSFEYYENISLRDTVIKGMPEFFKRYNYKFCPQDEILTLDYPVLLDLSEYNGIDKIYRYILCIQMEQKFLKAFSYSDIIGMLENQNPEHRYMIDNLCENVLTEILSKLVYAGLDDIGKMDVNELIQILSDAVEKLVNEHYDNDRMLMEYLAPAIKNIGYRLKIV